MPKDRDEIVEILEEIAVLLQIKGENAFKIRAYENGARALERNSESLETLVEEGRLQDLDGVGKALAEKVETLFRTGELEYYEKLKKEIPEGLREMVGISGLGGKTIHKLNQELGVDSLDSLREACESGKVAALKGFGEKSAAKILKGLENLEKFSQRQLLSSAEEVALPVLEGLKKLKAVQRAEIAGSLRRRKETVGDLDFIVASEDPESVMDWFVGQEGVTEVSAHGKTKSSVRFEGGLQADIRVVSEVQFPAALHHFTGSKDHNVMMRKRALERGLSLSEWGLLQKGGEGDHESVADEAGLFERLGLEWIPPELREGGDEIEWAESGNLPNLIELDDVRGALHNHTKASDGRGTLAEMAAAADELGWDYLGIADHSRSSFQANGLTEERLREQVKEIREFNKKGGAKVHLFAGTECDILKDGSLDFSDELLAEMDYVVAAIHQGGFGQDRDTVTKRIVRALEHPSVTFLAHPTGRLLLQREPYPVDLAKVIDAAAANGKWIEINAHPVRLDMDWREWNRAREKGVLAHLSPDAHRPSGLAYVKYGVDMARKAGLAADEVVNTRDLAGMKKLLGVD
ncbi:DNA polymerase/3'-5' exonuclease PolX [Puniceicoccus vermicola]|uniref:DNA-directed DNA polymerase n=1 Tax=Puniceicoccus vermicola TaxID=388746 RepID=A0A7X1AW49_9BACT|nr:DNA polymerase/3'-5' exonuclease PolX [Puniceicoccus vermicola]MBC2600932.1 DNA polymerase/3'-5' exonuclease PolX [Puniceicoccus vermicola]